MKNYDITTHDVSMTTYNEAAALQELLQETYTAAARQNNAFDNNTDDYYEQFTITVNGRSIAFLLGGVQINAIQEFILQIANENLYTVNFNKATVTE